MPKQPLYPKPVDSHSVAPSAFVGLSPPAPDHIGAALGGIAANRCIRVFSGQKQCEIQELNIQVDHVHVIVMIPPKLSVSDYLGLVKGWTAIRVFKQFPKLKVRPYWGNHFRAPGYCVDTIVLDEEKTRRYVQY